MYTIIENYPHFIKEANLHVCLNKPTGLVFNSKEEAKKHIKNLIKGKIFSLKIENEMDRTVELLLDNKILVMLSDPTVPLSFNSYNEIKTIDLFEVTEVKPLDN